MNARKMILDQLKKLNPKLACGESDLWDVLTAARGLTVIMNDGSVLPLPLHEGAARQLLHSWSVEARLN